MGEVAKSIDQGTKGMNGFGNAVKGALMKLGPYGAAAAAAFSLIGAAVSVAWANFKKFAQEAKSVRDGARSARMSTRDYAELSYVSQRTGVSLEAMVSAVQKITDAMEKAKQGNKDYLAFYDALGLSIAHLDKMKPAEKLAAIANAARMENISIKDLPSAKDVLGQENLEEVEALRSYNVNSIIEQGEQIGEVITPEMVNSVQRFQKAMNSASGQFMHTIISMKAMSDAADWAAKNIEKLHKEGNPGEGQISFEQAKWEELVKRSGKTVEDFNEYAKKIEEENAEAARLRASNPEIFTEGEGFLAGAPRSTKRS